MGGKGGVVSYDVTKNPNIEGETIETKAEEEVEEEDEEGDNEDVLDAQVAAPENADKSTEDADDVEDKEDAEKEEENAEIELDEGEGEEDEGAAPRDEGEDDVDGEDQESSFEPDAFNLMTESSSSSAGSLGSAR